MIAVFAGDKKQFDDFKNNRYTGKEKLCYIGSERDCRGIQFSDVICIGTWYKNKEFDSLYDYCIKHVENCGTSLTEEEYDEQMRGEIQRTGGG